MPLKEALALVIDVCAVQLEWPRIPACTVIVGSTAKRRSA